MTAAMTAQAAMLPGFAKLPYPRPLPPLPYEKRPIEPGTLVQINQPTPKGWPSGTVKQITRRGRVLVDQHGKGSHWHDLGDLVRVSRPDELIDDWYAARPPVIVIPCGREKRKEPAMAGDLYIGSQHRLAREAAEALCAGAGPGARILILSALHGLVDLDRVLEPYDVTLGDVGAVTAYDVKWQLMRMGARRVIALTPKGYTALLNQGRVRLDDRLAGTGGIGEQRAVLAAIKRGTLPACQ